MTRYLSRVPASEACDPIIHPFHSIHACQTHGSPSSGYASFDIIQMQSSYAQDRARTSENLEFLDLHLRLTPSSARTKSEWDVHYEFECPWKLTCISECRPATLQRSSIRTSFNLYVNTSPSVKGRCKSAHCDAHTITPWQVKLWEYKHFLV